MNDIIIKVLKNIESHGYEAYIIGGFVRDKLLNIDSFDVDIITNALPKDLIDIFNVSSRHATLYGTMKLIKGDYRFDIATYRRELSYNGRRPDKIEYINDLKGDLLRRDFTINTIAMNSKGEIIDYLNARDDLNKRIIKSVGNADFKFKEDPLRMLRALRFSSVLDFNLDNELINALKNNMYLIKELSCDRVKEELSKILASSNSIKTLNYMKAIGLLDLLNISYKDIVYVDDIMGMYAQINVPDTFIFTKEEKKMINSIKEILSTKEITNKTLYNYDLYISLVAGKILGYDVSLINKMYRELPIKTSKDLNIKYQDIINILNIKPSNVVSLIINDIIDKVLTGSLKNDKDELVKYIINNKGGYLNGLSNIN